MPVKIKKESGKIFVSRIICGKIKIITPGKVIEASRFSRSPASIF
jgi:hypothetical protein